MARIFRYILAFITVAVLLSAAVEVHGQHYVGVRAGYGGGSGGRAYPKRAETATVWGLYNGGISWKYFTKQKYVGGTQVDILYMQQGFKEYGKPYSLDDSRTENKFDNQDSTAYYKRTVNSIMVPLMWQPHVYLFNRNMRVFLNAGVTFSYNISSKYEHGSSEKDVIFAEGDYPFKTVRDNRWGYGLVAGGGLGYSFGRVEVLAEFRYYIGYSDIRKNWNKYYVNGDSQSSDVHDQTIVNRLRSPLDGMQGSVGVYYRLGKRGILSPPSPCMEEKLREIEEKRLRRKGLLPEEYPEGIPGEPDDGTDGDYYENPDGEEIVEPGLEITNGEVLAVFIR